MKRAALVPLLTLLAVPTTPARAGSGDAAGLASVYEKISMTLLAARDSETAVVNAILAGERDQALAALMRAKGTGGSAADLKEAAARIGDFATEGGAAVEPIRNRLTQAGHHHNASDTGPDAVYDTGYVTVTKKHKVEALDLAKRAEKAAMSGKVDAAEATAIHDAFKTLAGKVLAGK